MSAAIHRPSGASAPEKDRRHTATISRQVQGYEPALAVCMCMYVRTSILADAVDPWRSLVSQASGDTLLFMRAEWSLLAHLTSNGPSWAHVTMWKYTAVTQHARSTSRGLATLIKLPLCPCSRAGALPGQGPLFGPVHTSLVPASPIARPLHLSSAPGTISGAPTGQCPRRSWVRPS